MTVVKKYNKNETALKDLETKLNELTTAFTNFKSNDYPDLIPPRVRPIGDQLQQAQLKFDKAKTLFADCRTIENSNNFNSISTTFNDIEDLFGKLKDVLSDVNKLSSNLPYNIYCIKSRKYIKKASQNDNYLEKILELSVNELNFNNTEIKRCIVM